MKFIFSIGIIFSVLFCHSQSVHFGATHGRIVKHSKQLNYQVPNSSYNVELGILFPTKGHRLWHHYYKYPRYGVVFTRIDSRDSILGQIYSLMPCIELPFYKKGNFSLQTRLGTGPALANKYWKRTDTFNNYLGGMVNMYASVLMQANYRYRQYTNFHLGYTLSHTSNVGTVKPNKGVNLFGPFLSVDHAIKTAPRVVQEKLKDTLRRRDLGMRLKGGIGWSEYGKADGPLLPNYNVYAQVYHERKALLWYSGFNIEYNTPIYYHLLITEPHQVNYRAKSTSIYYNLGTELLWGKFTMPLQMDFYLNSPWDREGTFVQRTGVLYYPRGRQHKTYFIGLSMKSLKVRADYIEFVLGYNL